jgi:asparagine synthase (glutamine-hydrolysing)
MPGIVGLITKAPRKAAEQQLLAMLATLRHEPSYVTGTWIDESMGVYVGWALRKDSFCDAMPLSNETGNAVLIFSGEDHPEPGVAARLKESGHSLETEGPSYLVHLSEEDPSFPAGLNGWFHGLLVDRTRRKATLFSDRFGMHRLYYHESKDVFYFAAEAKAILTVCPGLRRLDPRGLGEYISLGCVLENRTLFESIHILPPASAWIFQSGSIESKGNYFQPEEWEQQTPLEPGAYYRELREVFSQNLPRYFNGPQRVAVSLTGGLDTRMIMAWWKAPPNSLPCYTFGGPYRDCQDVSIARRVAKICQQPYQVIQVGDEFLRRFAHYAERTVYLSDGCAGVNRAADLYANEISATIAPVRMTGNYGSEILRRLRMFKPAAPPPGLFQSELLPSIQAAKDTYARLLPGHPVSFTAFRQAPWHQYGLLGLEQTQLTLRSPYLDNDLVRTAFRAPNSTVPKNDLFENNDDCSRLIADGNEALQAIRTDRGLGGRPGQWSTPIARTFQEFTFRAEYAYDYGMPQWVARIDHAFAPLHLERLFLGRHKFCHFRVWYRDTLASYVREILLDSRTLSRPHLDSRMVEIIVRHHLSGTRNYTTEIHNLLTLELLHRLFLDASLTSNPENGVYPLA